MKAPQGGRARRVEAPALVVTDGARAPGYASAFAISVADADAHSAERWATSILDGAPRFLRWFVVLGWRLVLRLRLAPRGSAGTVAGWTEIEKTTPTSITLEVTSSLIRGRKWLTVDGDRVTLATYVWFENKRGRIVWSALAPFHHRIEPLLMTLAAKRQRADSADGAT